MTTWNWILVGLAVVVLIVSLLAKNRWRPSIRAIENKILRLLAKKGELTSEELEQEFQKGFVRCSWGDVCVCVSGLPISAGVGGS